MSNQPQWGQYQQGYGPPQGYPQGYGPPPNYPPPPRKRNNGCLIAGLVGGAILVLGFGGCLAFCGAGLKNVKDKQAKEEREQRAESAKDVTPEDMVAAYEKNEVAGDEKYKGKKLEIRGAVKTVDSGIGDQPVVRLESGNLLKTVMLFGIPKADAAKLSKGQRITAVCKGGGEVMGSPVLRECQLQ